MCVKKYIVVTGAISGIGYETAKAFAGRGKNLIVCEYFNMLNTAGGEVS